MTIDLFLLATAIGLVSIVADYLRQRSESMHAERIRANEENINELYRRVNMLEDDVGSLASQKKEQPPQGKDKE